MTVETITVTMRKRRTPKKERGGAIARPCDQVGEGSRASRPPNKGSRQVQWNRVKPAMVELS